MLYLLCVCVCMFRNGYRVFKYLGAEKKRIWGLGGFSYCTLRNDGWGSKLIFISSSVAVFVSGNFRYD